MINSVAEKRRDSRYNLKHGCAFAEFDDPQDEDVRSSGLLLCLSPAGVAVELATPVEFPQETVLQNVVLHVGECRLAGSIAVVNSVRIDDFRSSFGGLFYPQTDLDATKLMAMIAGMGAIDSIWERPSLSEGNSAAHSDSTEPDCGIGSPDYPPVHQSRMDKR